MTTTTTTCTDEAKLIDTLAERNTTHIVVAEYHRFIASEWETAATQGTLSESSESSRDPETAIADVGYGKCNTTA